MTLRNMFGDLNLEATQQQVKTNLDDVASRLRHNNDIFGTVITGVRDNQIEVHFDDADYGNYVTLSASGGGGRSQHEGHLHITSGTNTNGTSKVVTLDTIRYRPMHEVYAAWTAAFPVAGVANSYQRIGLGDVNYVNGLTVGYEDTAFGLSWFQNSVKTFVAIADWDDPLDGSVGSNFTRDGVPEAINVGLTNIFRTRVGLLGSAQLILEIYSPDGQWVTAHTFKRPNVSPEPTFTNFDLNMVAEVKKTGAGSAALEVRTACWAGGTTSGRSRLTDTWSDRSLVERTATVIFAKTPSGNRVEISANSQGRLLITNDSVGLTGAAVPASASAMGAQQGANLVIPKVGQQTNANGLGVTLSTEQETRLVNIYDKLVEAVNALAGGLPSALVSSRLATLANVQYQNTDVTPSNPLPVDVGANIELGQVTVAFDNSTPDLSAILSTPFGANETRETGWYDLLEYAGFKVIMTTDQMSAPDGAEVVFSENTSADLYSLTGTVYPNIPVEFGVGRKGRYAKFRYTNGPVAQTVNMRVGIIFTFQPISQDVAAIGAPTDDLTPATRVVAADHVRVSGLWVPNRGNISGDKYVTSDSIDSGEQEYTPGLVGGTVTSIGDTTVYTATAGKAFRIRSVTAIPVVRGSEEPPVITLKILNSDNTTNKTPMVGAALSKRKKITGPTDGKIAINLDIAARVPWTIDIEEFDP